MMKIALLSTFPLGLPASCWWTGCNCEWVCSALTHWTCLAASAAAAAVLFAGLALFYEFRAIQSLYD